MGIHIKFLNDAQNAALKAALAEAGDEAKSFASSETAKLAALAVAKYPALVSAFKAAFAEVETDSGVSGIARMGKAVAIVLPQVPAIAAELADLPSLEDFLIQCGQTIFTDGLGELEKAAEGLVGKLLAAL